MVSHKTPTFPLTLGEDGRGRQLAKILAPPTLRPGEILVAVRTDRSYTAARRSGKVDRFGPTRIIAEGRWAHGDAGRIASGPDLLMAVQPGSAWYSLGGDGVGIWSWVRPTGEVISLSATWRKANPQEAIPLLRELGALACLPPDTGWRSQLAELESQFGGAPAPVPEVPPAPSIADDRQMASASTALAGVERAAMDGVFGPLTEWAATAQFLREWLHLAGAVRPHFERDLKAGLSGVVEGGAAQRREAAWACKGATIGASFAADQAHLRLELAREKLGRLEAAQAAFVDRDEAVRAYAWHAECQADFAAASRAGVVADTCWRAAELAAQEDPRSGGEAWAYAQKLTARLARADRIAADLGGRRPALSGVYAGHSRTDHRTGKALPPVA